MESGNGTRQAEALGMMALAAWQWAGGREGVPEQGGQGVAWLRDAGGYVFAASGYRQRPESLQEVLAILRAPIGEIFPARVQEDEPLLDRQDRPTIRCEEILGESRAFPPHNSPGRSLQLLLLEQAQQRVAEVRSWLKEGRLPGGSWAYTAFRRFLIEHPFTSDLTQLRVEAGQAMPAEVAGVLVDLYEEVPNWARDEAGHVYPCPRCQWPMAIQEDRIACRGPVCWRQGVRFDRTADDLVPHDWPLPEEVQVWPGGSACVPYGIWRYTVQPGLGELQLARDLQAIPAEVQLWPELDAYDLRVSRNGRDWFVDVKDWENPVALGQSLVPLSGKELTIVVPDYRREQLDYLRGRGDEKRGFAFTTAGEFFWQVRNHE